MNVNAAGVPLAVGRRRGCGLWVSGKSRGLAFSAKGKFGEAAHEQRELAAVIAATPSVRPLGTSNHAKDVSELAAMVLASKIASARGDHAEAVKGLRQAVRMQGALIYEEPPIWYFPVRETLGAELFAEGNMQAAEIVYREDLRRNPDNPRSLYGLAQSLRTQGKLKEAATVEKRFHHGWRYADTKPAALRIATAARD